jgi:hypothetical protein
MYFFSSRAQAICELENGNILIAGGSSLHESNQYISDFMMYMFDSTGNPLGGNLYGQTGLYETAYDLWADPVTKKVYASGELNDQIRQLGLTIVADSTLTMVDIVNPGFGKLANDQRNLAITRNTNRSFTLSGATLQTGGGDFFLALLDSNLAAMQSCNYISLGPYSSWPAFIAWSSPQPYASTNALITATTITPQTGSGGTYTYLCNTVDIAEVNLSEETLSVYPNPSSGKFTIEVSEAGECRVVDVMGRVVSSRNLQKGKNEFELKVEKGVYYLSCGRLGRGIVIDK